MTLKETLIDEIERAPDEVLDEVLDFVRFLQNKGLLERLATAIASEAVLKRDWLLPAEEEAWQNL